jgi:prophage antirepressor-like protein
MDDINDILLKYNGKEILVVSDNNKKVWFNAVQICYILKYTRPRDIIYKLVDKEFIKQLKNIIDDYKIFPNAQPNSLFINEYGLYALLLRSKKKEAKKFFMWVVKNVIPDIRKKGYYETDKKQNKEIENLNKTIEKLYQEIFVLNNNNNKINNDNGNYIYIIKSPDYNNVNPSINDILKIGKTIKYKNRMSVHNSSNKNNVLILYRVKVDDADVVEQCLKALLKKQMYNRKEHYKISINDAVKTINKCIKLTKSKKISEDKYYLDMIKQNKITKNINEYGIEILFDTEQINNILLGGNSSLNNINDMINIINYDDYIFMNEIHNIIINLI